MIVIVACGQKKRDEPSLARNLYTGAYFRATLAYALTLAPAANVFILSALYGLVGLNEMRDPYDLTLGDVGAVTVTDLRAQARIYSISHERVVVLGGKRYVALCRQVWPDAETPLKGKGGLGKQIQWMRAQYLAK